MYARIKSLFSAKDKRNAMLRNNVLFSALLKVVGLSTSLLIVPITLNYLNNEVYGIWLTMSSILYWFSFFDIGLGNGMRNYLTEAISTGKYSEARSIISTTMSMLSVIAIVLCIVTVALLYVIDAGKLFNTTMIAAGELRNIAIIATVFTLILFVVKNVGMIFVAMQKYALNDLLGVSGHVIALVIIYILTKVTQGNLMYVVAAFTITPVLVFSLAAIPLFAKYPALKPSLKSIDMGLAHKVVGKGLGFFLIQITSCVVIFGCSNLFITQFCGPESVTTYNIAYKYFNILAIAYTIVISPMWNAYTDAYVKGDMDWIKSNFNRALRIWGLSIIGGLLMLAISNILYRLWVGDAVSVPLSVSLCTMAYICMFNLNNCVTYLLNGLNKIRVQIITSIVATILFLFIVSTIKGKYGIEGVVTSMALCYLAMAIVHLYQCRLLINQKAKGIWNR